MRPDGFRKRVPANLPVPVVYEYDISDVLYADIVQPVISEPGLGDGGRNCIGVLCAGHDHCNVSVAVLHLYYKSMPRMWRIRDAGRLLLPPPPAQALLPAIFPPGTCSVPEPVHTVWNDNIEYGSAARDVYDNIRVKRWCQNGLNDE